MPTATVCGLGKTYANGLEHVEISIDKHEARGLPFVEGEDVPIRLRIGGRTVAATLKATRDNSNVWISQSIVDEHGERSTLALLFRDAQLAKNQRLHLVVDGDVITATPVACVPPVN
jgi:hypothetical protein